MDDVSLPVHLLGKPGVVRDGEAVPGPRGYKAWALLAIGEAAIRAGALDAGLQCLRRAVADARGAGDRELQATALVALGYALVHTARRRDEEAAAALHEAISIAKRPGWPRARRPHPASSATSSSCRAAKRLPRPRQPLDLLRRPAQRDQQEPCFGGHGMAPKEQTRSSAVPRSQVFAATLADVEEPAGVCGASAPALDARGSAT